jgi:hypothetical protein
MKCLALDGEWLKNGGGFAAADLAGKVAASIPNEKIVKFCRDWPDALGEALVAMAYTLRTLCGVSQLVLTAIVGRDGQSG